MSSRAALTNERTTADQNLVTPTSSVLCGLTVHTPPPQDSVCCLLCHHGTWVFLWAVVTIVEATLFGM